MRFTPVELSPFQLAGRRALVTGAGQGIGAAIAAAFAELGAEVLVNDVVVERAETQARSIVNAGGRAGSLPFDVTDHASVSAALARSGPVDVLVNNAGNAGGDSWPVMALFGDTAPDQWERFLRINLYGVMHCVHAALAGMVERGWGRIVTIVSDTARTGEPYMAAYSAAKAGAAGFTRSIAREYARFGITANNIALGTMRTPLTEAAWADPDNSRQAALMRHYPIKRPGTPDDVAALAVYLASPAAEWITGQTIPLNGGYSMAL